MAGTKVTVANLDEAIRDILSNYNDEINGYVGKGLNKVANAGRNVLRSTSPKGATGEYKGGWGYKISREAIGRFHMVIYNQGGHRSLTHLLEKPHAKRNGGIVPGRPHIAPVNEQVQKAFVEYLDDVISKG